MRIGYYCEAHMRNDGHCPLPERQLAKAMGCTVDYVQKQVKVAKQRDVLHESTKSDRCLVAPMEVQFHGKGEVSACGWH